MGKRKKKHESNKFKNELASISRVKPWELFVTDEDKLGHEVLAMTDFLSEAGDRGINIIKQTGEWNTVNHLPEHLSNLSIIGDIGYSLINDKQYIVDLASLSPEIRMGLGSKYTFLAGDKGMLTSIVKVGEPGIIAQARIKEVSNLRNVVTNIHMIAVKFAIGELSHKLDMISSKLDIMHIEQRQNNFYTPFFHVRTSILKSADEAPNKQRRTLQDAADRLMGLIDSVMYDAKTKLNAFSSAVEKAEGENKLDEYIKFFVEDFELLIRYVGLYYVIVNYLEDNKRSSHIITTYHRFINQLTKDKKYFGGRTAFELLHSFSNYTPSTLDYWIIEPPKMLQKLEVIRMLDTDNLKSYYQLEVGEGA